MRNLEFADALASGKDEGVTEALEKAKLTRSAFEPTVSDCQKEIFFFFFESHFPFVFAKKVPALLEDEFSSNPFMRVHHASVAASAGCGLDMSGIDVLKRIRERKNAFDSNSRPTLG